VSLADGTSVIPPGWYPDPADDSRLRRWDGQQWTQEVLLAPEQAPAAASVPTAPPTSPAPVQSTPVQSTPAQSTPAQPSPSHAAQPTPPQGAPSTPPQAFPGNQPPVGQPAPASPSPSTPPPGSQPPPAHEPMAPTVPRPSPPVNQHSNPQSGPVSLPEWATLPGLTLPPDLSSLPGMESSSVLHPPTFLEPEPQRGLPTLPVFEPPFIPQRPDVQETPGAREVPAPQQPQAPAPPATPYAPPPSGAQYDVPPPPGMAHVPTSGPILPPSAFVAPQMPAAAWPQLPPVGSAPALDVPGAPAALEPLSRTMPNRSFETAAGSATASSWLIGVLPLLQFGAVYLVFEVLGVALAPGMQWGVLAIPAAFSLLFASADRRKLTTLGFSAPSVIFGLIPPLYLIVRCVTTGRSSVPPLIAWIVLQAGAVAGVYYLLPAVLAAAIRAIG